MHLYNEDVEASILVSKLDKSFYNSVKLFLWVNQLFCAAPVNILSANNRRDKFVFAAHLIYRCVLTLAIGLAVAFVVFILIKAFVSDNLVGLSLMLSQMILKLSEMMLVIIGSQYQRKKYEIFLKRLVSVDRNLLKCGVQSNYRSTKAYLLRAMIFYVIFFTCKIIADSQFDDMDGTKLILNILVHELPSICSLLALTQYAVILNCIRGKFRSINDTIEQQMTRTNVGFRLQIVPIVPKNTTKATLEVLRILRKQHHEIAWLMNLLIECFGYLIVVTLISSFLILSVELFTICEFLYNIRNVYWYIIRSTCWVILYIAKVLLIFNPVSNAFEEAMQTGNLIFNLSFDERDSRTIAELKTFSHQLLHVKSPVACGIVNLNLSVVTTMIGLITTYMLILFQFYIFN